MRLHRLSVRAMGPYPGEVVVDFDALGRSGLFLLEGPTGAGKSTLLDALTFALYGGLAGSTGSRDRLRSDFADPATQPAAELEFSVGGHRYRVRRSPAHDRPKRRGGGTTSVPASVRLTALADGRERLVSARVSEADDEVLRLLGGLTRRQFCQVVVLPQGEFATFLRAEAEERRDVLQRLFDAEHYTRVETGLAAQARDAQDRRTAAVDGERGALLRALEAAGAAAEQAGVESDPAVWTAGTTDRLEAGLDAIGARLAEVTVAAERAGRVAAASEEQAQRALTDATLLRARQLRRTALLRRAEVLAADSDAHVAAAADLAAARHAHAVLPAVRAVDTARAAVDRAGSSVATAVSSARVTVAAAGVADLPEDPEPASWRELARRCRDTVAVLAGAAVRETELTAATAALERLDGELATVRADLDAAQARDTALPDLLAAAESDRHERAQAAAELPAARVRRDAAATLVESLARLDVASAALVAVAAEAGRAIDAHQAAVDRHQQRVADALSGAVAALAHRLEPGSPCPVCGSADHPTPADPAGQPLVGDVEVARAEAERADAEAVRRGHESTLDATRSEVEQLLALVGGADVVSARTALVAAEARLGRLVALGAGLGAAEEVVAELRESRLTVRSRLGALAEQVKAGELRRSDLAAQLRDRADEVAHARDGHASVADRRTAVGRAGDGAQTVADGLDLLERARAVAASAEAAAAEALSSGAQPGTADLEWGLRAVRAAAALDADVLQVAVQAHRDEAAAVTDGLAATDLAALSEDVPDLDALAATHAAAALLRDEGAARAVGAAERAGRFAECAIQVREARSQRRAVEESTAALLRVAAVVAGAAPLNTRRMTLSTFVLRERFAAVVGAASRRLDRITDGRYLLERDEQRSGNRRAGLGLGVVDTWTGRRRDTRSLSGGEAFTASLALALGLADVVRDEAGGVELETLFVDEGFGSLDGERLDEVLDLLDELREGGRVIGVVSHVAELKERIPDRLEVRRRTDGSSYVRHVA